jgi:RHS repeat-associated protein
MYEGTKRVARIRVDASTPLSVRTEIFINNYQGSPVVVLSSTGNIQYQKYLDPWGNMEMEIGVPSSDIEFQYTDKELDEETGLYNFWNRYYDPVNRFMGRDRVHLEDDLENYFGINPYVFTNNNPIRNVDPDGNKGIAVQSGTSYQLRTDGFKYYQVDIYSDLTLLGYQVDYHKNFTPDATVFLSRDAFGTISRPNKYGSFSGFGKFGENKEAPDGIYTLWQTSDALKTNRLNLSSDGWGKYTTQGLNGERTGLQIHSYDPSYSVGCLTTGFFGEIDPTMGLLQNALPDITNSFDPTYFIKESTVSYGLDSLIFN